MTMLRPDDLAPIFCICSHFTQKHEHFFMWLVILARIENMKATYSQENSSTMHGGQILRTIYVKKTTLVQTAVERVFIFYTNKTQSVCELVFSILTIFAGIGSKKATYSTTNYMATYGEQLLRTIHVQQYCDMCDKTNDEGSQCFSLKLVSMWGEYCGM